MARRPFGGTTADVAQDAAGDFVSGATLTAWTAETGGTQVTDLQTPAGVALVAGAIVTGAGGKWKFLGPADGTALLWVDGGSGVRYLVQATDVTTRVSALEAGGVGGGAVASVNAKTGVVVLSASDVGADAAGAATSAQAAAISAAATDATTKANNAQSAAVAAAGTAAASAYLPIPTAVIPAWAGPGTVYAKGATVTQGGYFWTAAVAHTSGASFSGTVPGGNWVQGAPVSGGASSAAGVAFTPSGTITATDTQAAVVQVSSQSAQKIQATTVAYAATVTPNADTTDVLVVGALTGNITVANPTGTPRDGQMLRIRFAQDATGSRTVSWGTQFSFGTDVTASLIPTTASLKWVMLFSWNAAGSTWNALAIARGFA